MYSSVPFVSGSFTGSNFMSVVGEIPFVVAVVLSLGTVGGISGGGPFGTDGLSSSSSSPLPAIPEVK